MQTLSRCDGHLTPWSFLSSGQILEVWQYRHGQCTKFSLVKRWSDLQQSINQSRTNSTDIIMIHSKKEQFTIFHCQKGKGDPNNARSNIEVLKTLISLAFLHSNRIIFISSRTVIHISLFFPKIAANACLWCPVLIHPVFNLDSRSHHLK